MDARTWAAYPDGVVSGLTPMNGQWRVDQAGIVRRNGLIYILNDLVIKAEILRVNHNDPWDGGHFGRARTLKVI